MPQTRDVGVEMDFDESSFTPENPEVNFEAPEETFEIMSEDEVVSEPEPVTTDPAAEQLRLMAEQMTALSSMQQQVGQKSDGSDMAKLVETLRDMNRPKPKGFDAEEWKKQRETWAKDFYDKPLDILDERDQKVIMPAFQQLQGEISQLKQQLARQGIAADPKYSSVMSKYSSEVEQAANQLSGDPEAYKKAVSIVSMNHFDEILEEKIALKMAESAAEPSKPQATPGYTGVNRPPTPPKKASNRIVLSRAEKAQFDREYALSPMPDQKSFYDLVWSKRQKAVK